MPIALREYQEDVIARTREAMRRTKDVLIQAPTGSGKTVLASYMMNRIVEGGGRGYFICHRRELIEQTSLTFRNMGIPHGYIAAGYTPNPFQPIQVCSVGTLKNRLNKVMSPTVCIWDEAHHLGAGGWSKVYNEYPSAFHIGLSATPQRLDGRGLDDKFGEIVRGPSVDWLIENGFLAKYKIYSIPGIDRSGFHSRMGEYVQSEVELEMDRPKITGDIVRHWLRYSNDKLTIAFAVSVKHSKHLAEQFQGSGVMAVHLDGDTKKDDRRNALKAFARGDIRVITNVGLFGEGFDAAANSGMDVTVGCVIDANPTKSLGAWLQRCGRALRPQRTPAIILDHSGNAMEHGLPCIDREWRLEGKSKKVKSEDDGIAIKQCPKCYHVHRPKPFCPECKHVYKKQYRDVDHEDGELSEMDIEQARKAARREQGEARSIDQLIALGQSRGYKNPSAWARHVFNARKAKEMMGV